jgi:hypothetical protein
MKRFKDILLDELTKFELLTLNNRFDEIIELLDLDLDNDIHDNLIDELEEIKAKLKKSLKKIRIRESGLRIV